MKNIFNLEGKVALVTGAAHGIGYAMAKALALAGAKITFNSSNLESMKKGLESYKADGIDAKGYVCDVTDEVAVTNMVKQIENELGVIDILVNNAGIIKRIPMCDTTLNEFKQVIDVDLVAPFICSKAVIPSMIKKGADTCICMAESIYYLLETTTTLLISYTLIKIKSLKYGGKNKNIPMTKKRK